MGNSTSNIRIDIAADVNPAGFNATVAQMERVQTAGSKMASQYSGLNTVVKEHAAAVTITERNVANLLDRYDPLGAKLRALQADFKALDAAASTGRIAGRDDARVDQVYARMQQQITAASAATAAFDGTSKAAALSAGQLRQATQQLPMQFTDIFTSLAAGQSPMMVMLQQGGQLKDSFGGVGNAAKAMGGYILGLINPITLTAAALAAGGIAWYNWGKSAEEATAKAKSNLDKVKKAADSAARPTSQESLQSLGYKIQSKELDAQIQASIAADTKRSVNDRSIAAKTAGEARREVEGLRRQSKELEGQIAKAAEAENKKNKPRVSRKLSDADRQQRDYQQIADSTTSRIAVLTAQANATDKLTESEKKLIAFDAEHKPSRDKRIEQQRLAARGALEEAAALDKTAQAQQVAAKAREEANKGSALVGGLARDYTAEINGKNRAMNAPLLSSADKMHADNLDAVAVRAARAREEIAKLNVSEETRAQLIYKVNQAESEQQQKMEDLRQQVEKNNASWEYGAKVAMRNYLGEISDVAKQSESLVTKSFKGMEDALVNFVKTGKLDFASLTDSIISGLIRMQIQQSITQPLSAAMNSGGGFMDIIGSLFGGNGSSGVSTGSSVTGSSFTSSMPNQLFNADGNAFGASGVQAFANGGVFTNGIFTSPTQFKFANGGSFSNGVMGEASPEAVMPLTRGANGKLGVVASGGGSGSQVVLQVNIVNNASQQVSATAQQNSSGGFDLIIEQIEGKIASNVSRGIGTLNNSLSQTFGLNRAAGVLR